MRIEVFQGEDKGWYWHFVNRGRITANGESFPSKGNAKRAAKAVVRAIAKDLAYDHVSKPAFAEFARPNGVTDITWN